MPIRYACVNDGANMVSEFPIGEQPAIAKTMQTVLGTVPAREYRRQTVEDTEVNYHYLSNGDGRIIGCSATKDVKTRVVFAFLDNVETLVRGPNADLRNAKKVLQQKMEFHNDPANDKIAAVQDTIERAKDVMTDNVDKALQRGDRLDTMHATSVNLVNQSATFNKRAGDLKRQMCLRHAKMVAMVVGGVLVIVLILLMIICKPNFKDCS